MFGVECDIDGMVLVRLSLETTRRTPFVNDCRSYTAPLFCILSTVSFAFLRFCADRSLP